MWGVPKILRDYEIYNFFHDFKSQGIDNFIIFGAIYFLAYQLYSQMFVMTLQFLIRNSLRCYYFYKNKMRR